MPDRQDAIEWSRARDVLLPTEQPRLEEYLALYWDLLQRSVKDVEFATALEKSFAGERAALFWKWRREGGDAADLHRHAYSMMSYQEGRRNVYREAAGRNNIRAIFASQLIQTIEMQSLLLESMHDNGFSVPELRLVELTG